ncbi:hypothetical protein GCM10011374_31720 [Kocuria dechangensis]|uniref:Uncharacterized protein n=1 Tax=Kocuria dechangensis TaxID=1176249 RepID=A0A917H2P2_9MICC|nr:hypothetical protein [Kocuria dechangensis]GGG65504.1 hypothetical protein GCM10011374_31720 [Kocuria dechangensis]
MHQSVETRVMRTVYMFFLGVLLALFVGLGIDTVHPAPPEPQMPPGVAMAQENRALTPSEKQEMDAYQREWDRWEDDQQDYSGDVGLVALVGSVLLLGASLAVERRSRVLAGGVLLGGLFTLLYSIVRSLISQETVATFSVVTVALFLVLALGWRRFVLRPGEGPGQGPGHPGRSEGQRQLLVEDGPDGGDVDVRDGGVLPDR